MAQTEGSGAGWDQYGKEQRNKDDEYVPFVAPPPPSDVPPAEAPQPRQPREPKEPSQEPNLPSGYAPAPTAPRPNEPMNGGYFTRASVPPQYSDPNSPYYGFEPGYQGIFGAPQAIGDLIAGIRRGYEGASQEARQRNYPDYYEGGPEVRAWRAWQGREYPVPQYEPAGAPRNREDLPSGYRRGQDLPSGYVPPAAPYVPPVEQPRPNQPAGEPSYKGARDYSGGMGSDNTRRDRAYELPEGRPIQGLPPGKSGRTAYDIDVQRKMLDAVGGDAEKGARVFEWIAEQAKTMGYFPDSDQIQDPKWLKDVANAALGGGAKPKSGDKNQPGAKYPGVQGAFVNAPTQRWDGDLGWIASLVASGRVTEAQAQEYAKSLGINPTDVLVEKDRMIHRGNNRGGGGYVPAAPAAPVAGYGQNYLSFGGSSKI